LESALNLVQRHRANAVSHKVRNEVTNLLYLRYAC
jgi:hypothetical protein